MNISVLGAPSREKRILVLGYGNPGRQDDGLGPAVAAGIDSLGWPGVSTLDAYQLNIEDAIDVAAHASRNELRSAVMYVGSESSAFKKPSVKRPSASMNPPLRI